MSTAENDNASAERIRMQPENVISVYFPENPNEDWIHIFVHPLSPNNNFLYHVTAICPQLYVSVVSLWTLLINYTLCVVTEWTEEGDLEDFLRNDRELLWPLRLKIAEQIANALEFINRVEIYTSPLCAVSDVDGSSDKRDEDAAKIPDFFSRAVGELIDSDGNDLSEYLTNLFKLIEKDETISEDKKSLLSTYMRSRRK
ncbi:unnamed protein product [Rhizophagus irregularis]|nr:unnamed protein product [Rhizophagus irregularis]